MNSVSDILTSAQGGFLNTSFSASKISVNEKLVEKTETRMDLAQIKRLAYGLKDQLDSMLRVLEGEQSTYNYNNPSPIRGGEGGVKALANIETPSSLPLVGGGYRSGAAEQIIEGVFNGQKMVGPDGQEYLVSPNYASKSKMVEGDLLKLTITNRGQFIYKQIGPVERERRRGELVSDPSNDQWSVLADGKTYKILKASVTFYKGQAGDEVIFLVPKDANGSAQWGAVENIVHVT